MSTRDTYWASAAPSDLTKNLLTKIQEYYDFINRYNILDKWRRSYLAYYGMSDSGVDSSKMQQAGTNGELYIVKCNHFRSLLQNLLTLTTSQRPALQPKAENTDSKSLNQTVLARSVLDYYLAEKRLEKELKKAVEFSLIAAEGFLAEEWNATAGAIYTVDQNTGATIYDGDLEFSVYHPIDVIRECWSENNQASKWKILRKFTNKWDLAAKYPEMAEQILSVSRSPDYFTRYTFMVANTPNNEDYIPVYRFYHEPTEALPNGRQFDFIDTDVFFNDGPLAYKNLPVYRIAPADLHGTPFGYTVAYDLLGLQKNYDALFSIVTTNQINYGTQNICMPRGSEINVIQLAQGLNMIEYDKNLGKPEPLNLVQTPQEIFGQLDRIQHTMETLSGINSVARGNPEKSLHSGSALALVAAQAVQFNSGLQQSYNRLLEDVGTGLIEILQEYASTPRIAQIAGKSNRARVKEFKGSDLVGINRVTVEQVNPISKTAAGRLQEAQDLLQNKLITNPQHYFEVITTGNIETLYEHETTQILLIRGENEDLIDGKNPPVMFTDQHVNHIKEHATCLDSPDARQDPAIVDAVNAHIQKHIQLLKTTNPALLTVLGQTPLPPDGTPPGGPGSPPSPGAPSGPGGPPPHAPGPPTPQGPPQASPTSQLPALHNPTSPLQQQANAVTGSKMPSLPPGSPQVAHDAMAQMTANVGK